MRLPRFGWIGWGPCQRFKDGLYQTFYVRKWHPGYWLFVVKTLLGLGR